MRLWPVVPRRLVAAVIGATTPLAALPPPLSAEVPVSVAMHLHGSFSEGDASMELQTEMARIFGVDVLWWTDHDWRIETWNHTRRSGFEQATYEPVIGIVTEPDPDFPGETIRWVRTDGVRVGSAAVVEGFAREGLRALRLTAEDDWNLPDYRRYAFRLDGSRQQFHYPLASRPRISFSVYLDAFDPDRDKFTFEVTLSRHLDYPPPRLRYVIGSLEAEETDVVSLPFTPGEWNDYQIDVAADATSRFSKGGVDTLRAEDNHLSAVRIGVETKQGGVVVAYFDDFRIDRDESLEGDDLFAKHREIAAFWDAQVPEVREFSGVEISRYRPLPHLTAYGITSLPDYRNHDVSEPLTWAVEQMHARGGAVTYAHPFGPEIYPPEDEPEEERERRVRERIGALVASRLLGCDALEVGYRVRGGANLQDHLRAWHALIAHGIFVTGTGVNDAHGPSWFFGWGQWSPHWQSVNNFVTWLWTESVTEEAMLDALRAGRAYFGDPHEYDGTVDLTTADGFSMGRVILTDRDEHEVRVRITDLGPGGLSPRLVQVSMDEGSLEPAVLRDEWLEGRITGGVYDEVVRVDTGTSSFVRVEVWDAWGLPVVFSNPLHFVRDVPSAGIPAERLAGTVADLRIEAAERFVLTGFRLESGRRRLRIEGREGDGGGVLKLCTGERKAPVGVRGAATWSWDDGLLTLAGFGGDEARIDVSWADVEEAPEAPRTLALGPGRPRPGGGADVTFSLPWQQPVRIDVFGVDGRRVRTLVDDALEPGEHVATWDGRDARGRSAASGIYFLRLTAGNERLTSRAVLLR